MYPLSPFYVPRAFVAEYNLTVVTPPATPAVPTIDVQNHLNLSEAQDIDVVTALSAAAERLVVEYANLVLVPTTYDVSFDHFDDVHGLRIPVRPVTSVTSVTYLDASGAQQTLAPTAYDVDSKLYARIRPKYGTCFPVTRYAPNSVTVRFVAGASTVPPMASTVIKMIATHLYENRGEGAAEFSDTVARLLSMLSAPNY